MLDGRRTAPASIAPWAAVRRTGAPASGPRAPRPSSKNSWWTVVLKEGRTRQIREMFFRIGHPVNRLRRIAIGPLSGGRLPRGGWRQLEEQEVAALRRATGLPDPAGGAKRRTAKRRTAARPAAKPRTTDPRGPRPDRRGRRKR